jgi:LCP family protein required for cell wall assembly
VGLRLIVPALVLVFPALFLIFSLPPLPIPEPAPVVTVPTEIAIAREPIEDLAIVVDTPATEQALATEQTLTTVAATVSETPIVPTPALTVIPTSTPVPSWVGPSTFTFVALGVDQRNDREIPRTDTIMIGRVDMRAPSVNLVSIPRDLLVDIPGYGKDRINTAYVYGEQFKEPGGGIGLLKKTIEKNFGVQVDHFGLVDFQCFRTTVDAMGGVTVNVPRSIEDTHYPTEDYGTKVVKFEPGIQKMDGERALEYARTRYADSDFHRMQRQQLIVAALRDQFLQLRTLPSLPTMLSGCRNMRSDLGWREYLTLATTAQSLSGSRVSFAAIDERMAVDATLDSGAAVLIPRWAPIKELIAETFGTGEAGAADATSASTRASAAASPTPMFGAASPTPVFGPASPVPSPSPSPFPSPFPRDPSVARPSPFDVLPGDASLAPVSSEQPARRS